LFQYVLLHAETEQIRADNRRLRSLIKKFGQEAKELEGEDRRQLLAQVIELHRIVANHATQLRQGHMALRQYLVEFGMTPAARTRVKIPATKKAKSKLEEFMGAGATVHSPAKVQ
jgi:sulfur relay (sulfurtransferase) DsrC/TusE family protein